MIVYDNQKTDYKDEYTKTLLSDLESKYIYIPMSVIANNTLDIKRVAIFSYLKIHCGLNNVIGFTIPDMVQWLGMKPNKRTGNTNDRFLDILDELVGTGYFTYLTDKSKSSYMKCKLNVDYYYNDCSNGYAVLYLDEIQKIIDYQSQENGIANNASILLVFSYLRNKINRRPNKLNPEERTVDGIRKRKERLPDAFYGNISDISKELGIHRKTLSKVIDILEQELKLIVTDRAYRVKNEDNEFRTLPTLFANAYKREDKYLLNTEKEYGRIEIESKAKHMKQLFRNYKIDKRKRKYKIKIKGGDNSE